MSKSPAPNLNTISLGALRAVDFVAQLGSIHAAARELGVTPGAVSQQVLKAEGQLGVTLFVRTAAGVVLTDAGEGIAPLLKKSFAYLERAVSDTKRSEDSLSLSVAPVFATRWLVPRLPKFEAMSEVSRVNVDATARYVEPGFSGIDACLRVTSHDEIEKLGPDIKATRLVDQCVFPVCAPEIAEFIRSAEDLINQPIITDQNTTLDWDTWLMGTGIHKNALRVGAMYSDASLCIDAAIAGGGIFLAWDMLAADIIKRGDLVQPIDISAPSGLAYWYIVPKQHRLSKQLDQLGTFIRSEAEASLEVSGVHGGSKAT